jgi:Flp pilus assembly protein TadG
LKTLDETRQESSFSIQQTQMGALMISMSAARSRFIAFLKDKGGNFAMLFALAAVPLFGVAGLALDYSLLHKRMSAYQNATDNAALTAAVSVRKNAWARAKIDGENAFVEALRVDFPDVNAGQIELQYNPTSEQVSARASGAIEATMSGLVGLGKLPFEVQAAVNMTRYPIEVALALDVTDSMNQPAGTGGSQSKIEEMRVVGKEFINTLLSNPETDVKVGVVPFATFNRVSKSFQGNSWFRQFKYNGARTQCLRPNKQLLSLGCKVKQVCNDQDGVGGCKSKRNEWSCPADVSMTYGCTVGDGAWNGCVSLRAEPFRNTDEGYNVSPVMGRSDAFCPDDEIIPLTDNKSKLLGLVSKLRTQPMRFSEFGEPFSGTYTPTGVNWAMAVLSPQPPYEEAMDDTLFAQKKGKRYLVLMTDGANTARPLNATSEAAMVLANNKRTPAENAAIQKAADDNTLKLCEQAKARGITVYTVSFGADLNPKAEEMLKKCATSPEGHYFRASAGIDLQSAFATIAQGILRVYLSH